jgi:hypothetical protein
MEPCLSILRAPNYAYNAAFGLSEAEYTFSVLDFELVQELRLLIRLLDCIRVCRSWQNVRQLCS